jgi:hypothetical protein
MATPGPVVVMPQVDWMLLVVVSVLIVVVVALVLVVVLVHQVVPGMPPVLVVTFKETTYNE